MKEQPLWWRMFADPLHIDVVHLIGYLGCLYRDSWEKLKPAIGIYRLAGQGARRLGQPIDDLGYLIDPCFGATSYRGSGATVSRRFWAAVW